MHGDEGLAEYIEELERQLQAQIDAERSALAVAGTLSQLALMHQLGLLGDEQYGALVAPAVVQWGEERVEELIWLVHEEEDLRNRCERSRHLILLERKEARA